VAAMTICRGGFLEAWTSFFHLSQVQVQGTDKVKLQKDPRTKITLVGHNPCMLTAATLFCTYWTESCCFKFFSCL